MNPLIFVILIVMILFTAYHFWTDIRDAWNTGETFAEGMTNNKKIKLSIKGRWNSDITKELDCNPGEYTVDESPAYGTTSDCGARDKCIVELNDTCQARIRMLDRCTSAQSNHPFSEYISEGGQIEKSGCEITGFTNVPAAGAAAADPKNNVQYKCVSALGGAGQSFNTYDATTLTYTQKAMVVATYGEDAKSKEDGGSGPAYYACKQGCEDLNNGTCQAQTTPSSMAQFKDNGPPSGYNYTGESQCQDWDNNYVVCKTPLDGTNCGIKATTIDECAAECNKRDSCGEFYFKEDVCFLANGKCVPKSNPTNPQPHYKKTGNASASAPQYKGTWEDQPTALWTPASEDWKYVPAGPPKTDTDASFDKCKSLCAEKKECKGFEWNVTQDDNCALLTNFSKTGGEGSQRFRLKNGVPDPQYQGKFKSGVKVVDLQ